MAGGVNLRCLKAFPPMAVPLEGLKNRLSLCEELLRMNRAAFSPIMDKASPVELLKCDRVRIGGVDGPPLSIA